MEKNETRGYVYGNEEPPVAITDKPHGMIEKNEEQWKQYIEMRKLVCIVGQPQQNSVCGKNEATPALLALYLSRSLLIPSLISRVPSSDSERKNCKPSLPDELWWILWSGKRFFSHFAFFLRFCSSFSFLAQCYIIRRFLLHSINTVSFPNTRRLIRSKEQEALPLR